MNKELLAPAGNMECLKAAVLNGADAVYLACKNFGARKFASNFTNDEIKEAIKFCHLYGVKVYVTMNTLVKNKEVESFIEQARFLHKNGVDAILVQDFGMICLLREMFPNLEIHASTQANTSSYETSKFYYDLGIKRVVFSRELSIEEIDKIDIPIEKEAFIHGALCISYSGLCLMSSMLGERSGNRGECTGCCRLPYTLYDKDKKISNNKYLLSTKELNTSTEFDKLLNSSIYSFKIEGRMKSPLYVGFIVNLYRRLIDKKEVDLETETKKLKTIFNREFTKGHLFNITDKNIMNTKSPNHQGLVIGKASPYKDKIKITLDKDKILSQNDAIRFVNSNKGMMVNFLYDSNMKLCKEAKDICYVDNKLKIETNDILSKTGDYNLDLEYKNKEQRKVPIKFIVKAHINKSLEVSISDYNTTITKSIGMIYKAEKTPVDKENIIKHLNKLGQSPFKLKDIDIEMDENIFIQIKMLNEIRRDLVEKLIEKRQYINENIIENKVVFERVPNKQNEEINKISVSVRNKKQLLEVLKLNVDNIYVYDEKLYEEFKSHKNIYYILPKCSFNIMTNLKERNITSDYFDFSKTNTLGSYSLNVENIYTGYYLKKHGLQNIPISVELKEEEIKDFIKLYENKFGKSTFEVFTYGRVENMIIKGNILELDNKFTYNLKDIKDRLFPVYYDNTNTHILNYQEHKLSKINNCVRRLDFYDEDEKTISKIVKSYQ